MDGLPSLLMQAAASAAAADGVRVPDPPAQEEQAPAQLKKDEDDVDDDGSDEDNDDKDENPENDGKKGEGGVEPAPSLPNKSAPITAKADNLHLMLTGMNNNAPQAVTLKRPPKKNPRTLDNGNNSASSITDSGEEPTKQPLRRGKWTPEEEAYANRLIQEFKAGLLPLTDGTTLRTFLSKLLNCDPMRISKKFVGSNCIGKQVFRRKGADVNNLTPEQVQQTRLELSELEKKFLDRVSRSKSSKKSSSSAKKKSAAAGIGGLNGGTEMNRSAAAAGRALLQSNTSPQKGGAGGLFAQLQNQQPGMFDNSAANALLPNTGGNTSINNLMLQTGLNRDQIAQLASTQMTSSASLANLLGKQRSFDGLMSLDFQSMQSIDNLANLIKAGLPNQVPKAEMKNMDWGSQGMTNTVPAAAAMGGLQGSLTNLANNPGLRGSIQDLVRTLSGNRNSSAGSGGSAGHGFSLPAVQGSYSNQANANFGNLMPNSNLLQAQPNLGNLLQGMGNNNNLGGATVGGGGSGNNLGGSGNNLQSLLQNLQNSKNNNNNAGTGNLLGGQNANFNLNLQNPLLSQLNNNNQNPLMAMVQQQQLLGGMQLQQNGLGALGGMGNVGGMANIGGNFGLSNLGAAGNINGNLNTANLLQQLLAQSQGGTADTSAAGNKRTLDNSSDDGEPATKKTAV
ncbi:hypothetical protein ACHAWC_004277 [Mediolabrus comicus]